MDFCADRANPRAARPRPGDAPCHHNDGTSSGAQALAVSDAASSKLIPATASLAASLKKLDAAAVAHFGEPGRKIAQRLLGLGAVLQSMEHAQEKIENGTAAIHNGNASPILSLRQIEGQWRVVMPPPPNGLARTLRLYDLLIRAAEKTTAEIVGGVHSSPELAGEAFTRRVFAARLEAMD